jgi:hypothetical protein
MPALDSGYQPDSTPARFTEGSEARALVLGTFQ